MLVTHGAEKSDILAERETKKFPSRSFPSLLTFDDSTSTMTKRVFPLLLLVLALAGSGGCVFSKKAAKPKENSAISSEVETEFRQRWMDKRVSDLVAQGTPAPTAREQAAAEFKEKYSYAIPAQK